MSTSSIFKVVVTAVSIGFNLAVTGCGSFDPPKTIKSPDGQFQLTVPSDWIEKEPGRKGSVIYTSDPTGNQVVIVTVGSRADSVDDLVNTNREGLIAEGNSSDVTGVRQLVINGNQARQYEVTRNGPQIRCLMTAVAASGQTEMIAACADLPKYNDSLPTLKSIAESFR